MGMLEFDGRTYAIDMVKLMEWVSEEIPREKNVSTSVTMVYSGDENEDDVDGDSNLLQKEISEVKTSNETMCNLRYDIAKSFIAMLTTTIFAEEGMMINSHSTNDFTFPQILAFNTLKKAGILVEIN